jgi:hypothetical protein
VEEKDLQQQRLTPRRQNEQAREEESPPEEDERRPLSMQWIMLENNLAVRSSDIVEKSSSLISCHCTSCSRKSLS